MGTWAGRSSEAVTLSRHQGHIHAELDPLEEPHAREQVHARLRAHQRVLPIPIPVAQHPGTAGKIENSQVAVFTAYVGSEVRVLWDKRLYMPAHWFEAPERLKKAGVPKDLEFQTKPAQAWQQYVEAKKKGLPIDWVTGDTVYGQNPGPLAAPINVCCLAPAVIAELAWLDRVIAVEDRRLIHSPWT